MWILIMTLVTYTGSGVASAEFSSKSACESAGAAWDKQVQTGSRNVYFICVSKGE